MFAKIFALFAVLAVAFAAPNPEPKPEPQLLAYSAGFDYGYGYPAVAAVPSVGVVSPYSAPVYPAYAGAYFVRK